jgi:hypothetical protein
MIYDWALLDLYNYYNYGVDDLCSQCPTQFIFTSYSV